MRHTESHIQRTCVHWFRYQYPHLALLLFHPKNEGHGSRVAGAIAKAEGVVPGVPDLILALPSWGHSILCLELKSAIGRQSPAQKTFQQTAVTATAQYEVIRTLEEFQVVVSDYLAAASESMLQRLTGLHRERERQEQEEAVRHIKAITRRE